MLATTSGVVSTRAAELEAGKQAARASKWVGQHLAVLPLPKGLLQSEPLLLLFSLRLAQGQKDFP